MEGILTAAGQLAHASEFRFSYWYIEDVEHRYYTVRKGVKRNDGKWAICDGGEFGAYWDGAEWDNNLRGPSAYRYDLDDALLIAQDLAFEENQRWIEIFEAQRPGEIRGSSLDMARRNRGGDHG